MFRYDFMPYVVYILECSDGSYYTGSAADLSQRLRQHEQGAVPSSYTYGRRPVRLLWASEECKNYSQALRWEKQIKGLESSKETSFNSR